jgi:hypothetical protein
MPLSLQRFQRLECLWRAVVGVRVSPTQPIASDNDKPGEHAPVIAARLAVGLRKEGLKPSRLRVAQLKMIAHATACFPAVNQHSIPKSMSSDPSKRWIAKIFRNFGLVPINCLTIFLKKVARI